MINLNIKFIGLLDLKKHIGKSEITIALKEENTFGSLIEKLKEDYGKTFIKSILNSKNVVADRVQVIINEEEWINREDMSFELSNNDKIIFLLMMAGG